MPYRPNWREFQRYPFTAGTIVLAVGVTIAWWGKVDIRRCSLLRRFAVESWGD
jgi:hypothetical protein